MLDNDINISKHEVNEKMPWTLGLDELRLEVLYEMCFQLGFNRLSMFKKMLNAMREGDFNRAADEMLNSAWHKQTPKRCEELSKIMRNGF